MTTPRNTHERPEGSQQPEYQEPNIDIPRMLLQMIQNQNLLLQQLGQQQNANTSNNSPRVKPTRPDTYSGTRNIKELDSWLFMVEQYSKVTRLTSQETVQFAVTLLRGDAAVWWRNHIQTYTPDLQISKWNEFMNGISQEFKPVNASWRARDRLASLRQKTSVQTYTSAF